MSGGHQRTNSSKKKKKNKQLTDKQTNNTILKHVFIKLTGIASLMLVPSQSDDDTPHSSWLVSPSLSAWFHTPEAAGEPLEDFSPTKFVTQCHF